MKSFLKKKTTINYLKGYDFIMNKYDGIFTALLTPFDENNKINEKELEKLIKFNINMGVSGFYVGGSTGEAFLLSTEERKYVFDIVKACAPQKTLIAHIGSINEAEASALGLHAALSGYDLVSSITPFYYKFTFEEIKGYYCRLADLTGLPMLVYHFPAFSGVSMNAEEMTEFLSDKRFAGIKFTSNDFFSLERCRVKFPEKVIYNGFDEMFMSGLAMGADGAIGSTYNFMADKFVKIQKLFNDGRINEARKIQNDANEIIALLCRVGVMKGEKEILNQLGFNFGECRHPFTGLSQEEKELIEKEIMPKLN